MFNIIDKNKIQFILYNGDYSFPNATNGARGFMIFYCDYVRCFNTDDKYHKYKYNILYYEW